MAKLLAYPEPMNVADFLAFTADRPDGEKWELLDGELVMNASPVRMHQRVVGNLIVALNALQGPGDVGWEAIPGIGVRLSLFSSVEPDVMIRPFDDFRGNNCDDIFVAFEVLSPSTRHHDLKRKRKNYPLLPSLSHYVVISADEMEVRAYARANDFKEQVFTRRQDSIAFDNLGIALSLAQIYRNMPQASAAH